MSCSRLNVSVCWAWLLPSVLWRCWLGSRKGIRPVKTGWWGAGMVVCLEWGADLVIWPSWCYGHLLSLVSVKSRLVLPFWYQLTRVVPEKAVKRVCVCVCLTVSSIMHKKAVTATAHACLKVRAPSTRYEKHSTWWGIKSSRCRWVALSVIGIESMCPL